VISSYFPHGFRHKRTQERLQKMLPDILKQNAKETKINKNVGV